MFTQSVLGVTPNKHQLHSTCLGIYPRTDDGGEFIERMRGKRNYGGFILCSISPSKLFSIDDLNLSRWIFT